MQCAATTAAARDSPKLYNRQCEMAQSFTGWLHAMFWGQIMQQGRVRAMQYVD